MSAIPTRRAIVGDEATVFIIGGNPVCLAHDANQAIELKDGDQICVRGCPPKLVEYESILNQRPLPRVKTIETGDLALEFEGVPNLHPLSILENQRFRVWQLAPKHQTQQLHAIPDALAMD